MGTGRERRVLRVRDGFARSRRAAQDPALFLADTGKRLGPVGIRRAVVKAAERAGLHTKGAPLEERFGPHCCRHWHATHLLRAGMERSYVQWLRGDVTREAIDVYNHIDPDDVRQAYHAHMPRLGI